MNDYSRYADSELVALLKESDRVAYEEIYHRYKFILHHHAFNKLRDKAEAEDVLQEVFTQLWVKREVLEIGNLSGYLYGSLRNRILNYFDHKMVQLKYIDNVKPALSNVETDHRVRENQLRALIDNEIAALPPRTRLVFEMSRKKNMTYKEIAAELGTSEETVKKQVGSALKALRVKLGLLIYIFLLINY